MASLPASVAANLRERTREFCGEHGFEFELLGYTLAGEISAEDRRAATQLAVMACAPANRSLVHAELAKLWLMTAHRPQDADSGKLAAAAYADAIAPYPLDVIVDALLDWRKTEKWWPAWSELFQRLEPPMKKRRALLAAVRADPGDFGHVSP